MSKAQGIAQSANQGQFKNRILNGDCRIDQRNAGASVTPTTSGSWYATDRFAIQVSQNSRLTAQQNAGAITPPAGFTNYLGFTSSSAYSVISSDYFVVQQRIEGFNTADLSFGTASASTITLSFWVRSSLTGTFGGSVQNSSGNRCYVFSYTISSANTWEQKTITIAGDTTGTWLTTNGIGLNVYWSLGSGTANSGAAGSWGSTSLLSATGATSVVGTNGATFYLTGVQLEKGSTATSFDYRPYGTELALCQRYYETSYSVGTSVGTATIVGQKYSSASAAADTTGYLADGFIYQVAKRAIPTITLYDNAGNSGKLNRERIGVGTTNNVSATISPIASSTAFIYTSGSAAASGISYQYAISAEL